jgi:hypothetical protein
MGYIRDDGLSVVVGPSDCMLSAGTWTDTVASGVWSKRRTAAGASFYLGFMAKLLQHESSQRGSYITSVDLYYKVGTAALTSLAATIYLGTFPADGAVFADPVSQAFSYDAGHDTAGERVTVDEHSMTLTITTPFWVANDELVIVQLAVVAAAGSVFDWYGARFDFTLRL